MGSPAPLVMADAVDPGVSEGREGHGAPWVHCLPFKILISGSLELLSFGNLQQDIGREPGVLPPAISECRV